MRLIKGPSVHAACHGGGLNWGLLHEALQDNREGHPPPGGIRCDAQVRFNDKKERIQYKKSQEGTSERARVPTAVAEPARGLGSSSQRILHRNAHAPRRVF